MAKVTFQGRIPEELMAQVEVYRAENGGISPTEAMERMVQAFFNPIAQDHADQGMLIKALESEFAEEMARAKEKYPAELWAKLHPWDMAQALKAEFDELYLALWSEDLNGEHGILKEAMHVEVVARRIVSEMKRRLQK